MTVAVLQTTPDAFGARLAELAETTLNALEGDAAIAFDEEALRVAAEAGIRHRFAIVPGLGVFPGSARLARACFLAHDRLPAPDGVPTHVVGPIAPLGFAPLDDADARRADEKLAGAVIVVPGRVVTEAGMTFLLQLSLVSAPVSWLFDVQHDPALADALRSSVPVHDLDAAIFARADEEPGYWPLAHAVIAEADSVDANRALAVGAGIVTLPGSSRAARAALEASGVATSCDALGTLAVAIDTALGRADVAAQAARDLDAAGSAGRAIELARRLMKEPTAAPRPKGLPAGLERLSRDGAAPKSGAPKRDASSRDAPSEDASASSDDLESQIDAELAALRKKLQ